MTTWFHQQLFRNYLENFVLLRTHIKINYHQQQNPHAQNQSIINNNYEAIKF